MTNVYGGESPSRLEGKLSAMIICWILGFGSLISWNSMLTIGDYYYNLTTILQGCLLWFINPSPLEQCQYWHTTNQRLILDGGTYLDTHFSKTAPLFNTLHHPLHSPTNLYPPPPGAPHHFFDTTSGRGGLGSFIGICVIVAFFGVADACVQGGIVGDLSFMLPDFIQSFFAGLAASGALTSALRLITKAAFEKSNNGLRKGAMLFLAISTLFEFLCVLLYTYFFPKLPIVKYFRSKAALEGSKTVQADLAAAGIQTKEDHNEQNERLSNKQLFIQNIDYALDLFLIYVLTLSIFPGFLYENTGEHKYPLVLIASYNVWDLISRYLPLVKFLKIESRKGLTIAILYRFLLIPAFYFTAKYGDQGWMILLVSFLGLTNGHLTVCVMTAAPKGYKGPEQNALGNILVLCLLLGIFAGVSLDWLWLIGKKNAF
ncbi:equilibrative nucleotide transporter 3-like [Gossypium australe]|uniref:Equilibrative nucleotide transporter 3-like n=1 Tax=Gossypium australe TaxID=47621 RepID=A0A5B6W9E5_9ROSI|nr:equilibrative nucleotide transporter 3-like [Gossypium australe]KAA3477963.1 equilibrative nucleotide transporter 3-like [Gossypium australe]